MVVFKYCIVVLFIGRDNIVVVQKTMCYMYVEEDIFQCERMYCLFSKYQSH